MLIASYVHAHEVSVLVRIETNSVDQVHIMLDNSLQASETCTKQDLTGQTEPQNVNETLCSIFPHTPQDTSTITNAFCHYTSSLLIATTSKDRLLADTTSNYRGNQRRG